jgi:hypothetical protein
MVESFEKIVFHLLEGAGDAGTGGHGVSAAFEEFADLADIDDGEFRAGADADEVFGKFLEEDGGLDAFDGAEVVDDAFVVLGNDLEFADHIERE